jgi:AcrR family transcriptional regulator
MAKYTLSSEMWQDGAVSVRKYEQVVRADGAEQTRRRILDAVGERLREAPNEQLSLEKVARTARVSRSTIYSDFGSRAGLFDAFVVDLWQRTGLPALTEAVAAVDAGEHLRNGISAATRMKAQDLDIYRILHAMDRLGPESAGGAVRAMEVDRRGGMDHLARRLHEDGLLRSDVTVEWAVDVLWMLTSFESLDLLMTGRGLSVDDVVERLVTTAERTLCVSATRA